MAATISPFVHTATGVLGDKRDSMLFNQLHLRVSKVMKKNCLFCYNYENNNILERTW